MSNILRVTTPITGYENAINTKQDTSAKTDSRVQGPVAPEKVMRPDARSDSGAQEQNVGMKFYGSNFENFIGQMKDGASVAEEFSTLLFERFATLAESGVGENTSAEVARFMDMIQMSPKDMLAFIQDQSNAAVRFQGAFFSLLRQVLKETKNVDLKASTLEFVKRYTDMAEGTHIMEQIKQTIKELKGQMFTNAKEKLEAMEQELKYGGEASKGDTEANTSVIKNRILPFLNQYISSIHERGDLRENAALLAALAARYENGEEGRVMESFRQLMEYPAMQKYFRNFSEEDLFRILSATEFEKAVDRNSWMKEFAELIKNGMTKSGDMDQKQVFRNIMTSILLNESVYMPVLHMMLPMQVEGRMMFAEMWVDPDAEGSPASAEQDGRTVQGLVKFDIQDVGFFDLYFIYKGHKVNLQLNYPDGLKDQEKEIRGKIEEILVRNGLESEELYFGSSKEPIAVSEAFPQIFERKNSINVKI